MTIIIGWWALPTIVTIASYLAVWFTIRCSQPSYGDDIIALLSYGVATIASLVVWLIWAVLT